MPGSMIQAWHQVGPSESPLLLLRTARMLDPSLG